MRYFKYKFLTLTLFIGFGLISLTLPYEGYIKMMLTLILAEIMSLKYFLMEKGGKVN